MILEVKTESGSTHYLDTVNGLYRRHNPDREMRRDDVPIKFQAVNEPTVGNILTLFLEYLGEDEYEFGQTIRQTAVITEINEVDSF